MIFVRRAFAVVVHCMASLLLLTAHTLSYAPLPEGAGRFWWVCIPMAVASVLYGIGAWPGGFSRRWLPVGVAILVVAGLCGLTVLSLACFMLSPETMRWFAQQGQPLDASVAGLGVGFVLAVVWGGCGWLLVRGRPQLG
ncbi:hypothetical protein [Ralstonia pseudosolanacearum]|uniref:hypothetical protein n=1 Tax=Ralstonia pseudosolanacearum TaxID=1310165 RepID=UPI0005C54AE8|nr:hypothetical protein [Ralstonia pseudosolanacearum]